MGLCVYVKALSPCKFISVSIKAEVNSGLQLRNIRFSIHLRPHNAFSPANFDINGEPADAGQYQLTVILLRRKLLEFLIKFYDVSRYGFFGSEALISHTVMVSDGGDKHPP